MAEAAERDVAIVGAGVAGLTLGLALHARGIPCTIYERAPVIEPLGVGINILPHASAVLDRLGLTPALERVAISTRESAFFNRFGQLIYKEALGRAAGYPTAQFSIHRGDLQAALMDAFIARVGAGRLVSDRTCQGFKSVQDGVIVEFTQTAAGRATAPVKAAVVIGCDGIGSVVRRQLHPDEGEPKYTGINMWRGVTTHAPILGGATMIRAGWLKTGKMVIYPIRDNVDGRGNQLINWVAEIETPRHLDRRDWNRGGKLEDFLPAFAQWHFDWLDVPALIEAADQILEFPMVDQDPLPFWGAGRVTLMGDAAHPMVPRGSNGAGQAILDADCLAGHLARTDEAETALKAYEAERLDATAKVVLTNRIAPPDIILKEIFERTGDKPFDRIDEVISQEELMALQSAYKRIAGYDLTTLRAKAAEAG